MPDDKRTNARAGAAYRAKGPARISPRGWRDALTQALRSLFEQETELDAAGIAFYVVWALFPALVVAVVVVAKMVGRGRVLALLAWLKLDLPRNLSALVLPQFDAIARHSGAVSALTLGLASVLAIWAGMRGARGLMTALNTVYGEREKRAMWHRTAIAFVLAFLGGMFLVFVLTTIVLVAADAPSGEPGVVACTVALAGADRCHDAASRRLVPLRSMQTAGKVALGHMGCCAGKRDLGGRLIRLRLRY